MSNICSYKVKESEQSGYAKDLRRIVNRQCFADLRSYYKYIESTNYYCILPNNNFTIKDANWFIEQLKKWRFNFETYNDAAEFGTKEYVGVYFNTFVVKTQIPVQIPLITLMALRYLDRSEALTFIITKMREWSNKYPKIDTFILFQLAHIQSNKKDYGRSFNYNHSFCYPWPNQKLCTLDSFWKRVESKKYPIISLAETDTPLNKDQALKLWELRENENFDEILKEYVCV